MTPPNLTDRFPAAADQLAAYADLLAGPGVERGLIGPREVSRLWERHILNCAVVANESDWLAGSRRVLDVGSGAGLPGLVFAIVQDQLSVTLLDSMKRRTDFLAEAVTELGLSERVTVVRARAEEAKGLGKFDAVTSRAVAPLVRLIPWSAPHVAAGGAMLALKGASVTDEISEARHVAKKYGAVSITVEEYGSWLDQPTGVAVLTGFRGR